MKKQSMLGLWLPVAIWSAFIAMQSFSGSPGNTGGLLEALLVRIFGQLDPVAFDRLHILLRKAGHFLGYGILGFLWFRALSLTFTKSSLAVWFGAAIACAFFIAALDEWHQSFLPDRTGRVGDVALDTFGALVIVSLAMAVTRRPRLRNQEKL